LGDFGTTFEFTLKNKVMKKLIPLSFLTIAIISSCSYDPYYYDPVADFSVSTVNAEPYEIIYFDNNSTDATSFYWNFGDGYTSYEANPQHSYSEEGTYTITLTVQQNHGGSDITRLTVDIYYTQLKITVAEWNEAYLIENRVPYATVKLYGSMYDWDHQINLIAQGTTDRYGVIVFDRLDPVSYFIDAYSPYYDNYSIREDLPDLIFTDPLIKSAINNFTAWVDFVPNANQQSARQIKGTNKIKRVPELIKKNK
jgi:hypothetical protein